MKAGCMKRTRQFRRDQMTRKKNRFRRISKDLNFGLPPITEQELTKWVGLKASSPKSTQCQCCCSPRYSCWYNEDEKLTMQERRANRAFNFQVSEL